MPDRAGMCEAEFLVQAYARLILRVNAANQHVIALLTGPGNNLFQQFASNSPAAMFVMNIYGMLNGVLVGRPGPEGAVARETGQPALFHHADDRVASFSFCLKPGSHAFRRPRLVIVERG